MARRKIKKANPAKMHWYRTRPGRYEYYPPITPALNSYMMEIQKEGWGWSVVFCTIRYTGKTSDSFDVIKRHEIECDYRSYRSAKSVAKAFLSRYLKGGLRGPARRMLVD